MHGNLLSKSTKLRALCFLKLFLLVLMVWSENSRGHVWGQSFVLDELYSSRIFAKPFRDGSTLQWTGYQLTQQRKFQYMRTTKTVRESNSWEEIENCNNKHGYRLTTATDLQKKQSPTESTRERERAQQRLKSLMKSPSESLSKSTRQGTAKEGAMPCWSLWSYLAEVCKIC